MIWHICEIFYTLRDTQNVFTKKGTLVNLSVFWNIKYELDLTGKGKLAGIASLIPGFLESAHWVFRRVYKIGYNKKKLLFSEKLNDGNFLVLKAVVCMCLCCA